MQLVSLIDFPPVRLTLGLSSCARTSLDERTKCYSSGSESKQRQAGQGLPDKIVQVIHRWSHHPPGARVAEEPLDCQVSRERRAATRLHCEIGHVHCRLQS